MTTERWLALAVWLLLLAVAFTLAPPPSPDTSAQLVAMMTGRLEGVNLSLFALFNLMGVFPMAFFAVLAFDAPAQRAPKWPFVLGSFALGAFALLPYLVLRRWHLPRREASTWWLRALGSRALAAALVIAGLGLAGLFVSQDVDGFVQLARTQQFPFVMSFDFVACCVAAALLAREEARRSAQPWLAWLGLVPAVGLPLVSLLRRR
ncbi:MAG: DUF2834 domain-containing protein [Myxococcaceae bacterium]|jgi:hypothetical protein|nr:DUF2834 domain-containing protein [Myxococcaceae bacterium]